MWPAIVEVEDRSCAGKRHPRDVELQAEAEQPLACKQVLSKTHPGEAVFRRLGAGERDEFLQRLRRHRWMHQNDRRRRRYDADRGEALDCIVLYVLGDHRRDCQIVGDAHERIAVGRGGCRHRGAAGAARTADVLDVELLAECFAQLLCGEPGDDVGRAARRIGYDDADRTGRITARGCLGMARNGESKQQQTGAKTCEHALHFSPSFFFAFPRRHSAPSSPGRRVDDCACDHADGGRTAFSTGWRWQSRPAW